uniref:Uncharacterized protein n=1 Tax=Anguilla anguilla TaxID=7936 RepID=A0A0E9SLD8_ANGAN
MRSLSGSIKIFKPPLNIKTWRESGRTADPQAHFPLSKSRLPQYRAIDSITILIISQL